MGEFNMSKKAKRRSASDSKVLPITTVVDVKTDVTKSHVTDGFANFASRVGAGPNMDNQLSESFYQLNLLTRNRMQLEAAYRGSWIVGKMVDAIAEDMTKAGVTITSSDAAEDIEDLQAGMQQLGIWNSLCDAVKWARLYGGAIGVIMIDGQDLASPLRIETIAKGQFTGLAVYDRWQLNPDLTEVIRSGPEIGLPAYYSIITSQDILANEMSGKSNLNMNNTYTLGMGIRVHHTRVVRLIGVKLPFFQAITEMLWGASEIERIHDRLISFDNATMSSANLINHAHLRTVSVDGLREILSSGGKAEEGLIKMFEYMRLLQSNEGVTLLDGKDSFATTAYSFAGLSDMLLQYGQQLSGASDIPLVRLFGQSPAGLNSTGESDLKTYYDGINKRQETNLRSSMTKIIKVTYRSMFGKDAPSDMSFTFTNLNQLTPDQKSTIGRTKAETIAGVFEAGLIKKSTAIKELRQASPETGMFSNITDEDINEAEQDDDSVPLPGGEVDVDKDLKLNATDSLFKKVMKKLGKK